MKARINRVNSYQDSGHSLSSREHLLLSPIPLEERIVSETLRYNLFFDRKAQEWIIVGITTSFKGNCQINLRFVQHYSLRRALMVFDCVDKGEEVGDEGGSS